MEDLDDIALLVKGKRSALGMSQRRLARYARMSQSAIARMEGDIRRLNPSYEAVYRVVRTLDDLSSIETKGRVFSKTAAEIMQRRIVSARPDETAAQAIKLIRNYDFPQLPVIDRGMRVIGAVSQKRLMDIATSGQDMMRGLRVGQIIDGELPRVGRSAELGKIKKVLEEWDAVLVVEKDRAVGIITIYDVLRQM